ncbi:hypothetical protein GSI_12717 [Ganoderma sinense ZZ0214-1]|uniref:BTB domain-containing protein n=1 Tax=Ganoderma sinense ZZ0214-1 TaxID=1077348 RepID=A0A2G8RTI7_9APHY|nr:hypothetical protein GSI_12717 [Ganoderma sinense ZZ0214-1]
MTADATQAGEQLQAPTAREAEAPFNREDADFVLRTADGVHFRVFRTILMLASGGFAGMLDVPQPPTAAGSEETETPGVDVSEDSETMDTFLRICYPHVASDIEVGSLSHLRKVLKAGQKYDAAPVVDVMRRALVQPRFIDDNPLVVFAIACRLDLEEEAKEAAKVAVMKNRVKDETPCPEMDDVGAGAYYRLMLLNQTRLTLRATIQIDFNGIGTFCRNAPPDPDPETTIDSVSQPFTDADADVVLLTSDSLEFRIHSKIIELASPNMFNMLTQDPSATEQRVYIMNESSAVADPLLRFCYPGPRPLFPDAPNTFLRVLAALQKYGLTGALDDAVRAHWAAFAATDPFRFFFHAVALGRASEARACARLVAESDGAQSMHTLYVPEMEGVGSLAYRRLLAYVKRFREAATQGFQLSGFRARPCVDDRGASPMPCPCRTRCPLVVSTRPPAAGFEGVIKEIKSRLEKRPTGRVLAGDVGLVGAVLDAMHAQRQEMAGLPISASNFMDRHAQWTSSSSLNSPYIPPLPTPEFQCTMSAQVDWASSLLQCYADAVDGAVSQVQLDLSNVITE